MRVSDSIIGGRSQGSLLAFDISATYILAAFGLRFTVTLCIAGDVSSS